jgi:hypothetical protein
LLAGIRDVEEMLDSTAASMELGHWHVRDVACRLEKTTIVVRAKELDRNVPDGGWQISMGLADKHGDDLNKVSPD